MTKVDLQFRLSRPLDDSTLQRIPLTSSVYGIQRIRLSPAMDELFVEYDASRLRVEQVESVLRRAGLPVVVR